MLAILREISVTCFFTSYLVVLVLELLRLVGRIPGRGTAVILMMIVGLFTHISYLILRAIPAGEGSLGENGSDLALLATWFDWLLLLALGLAIGFLVLYIRRPDTIISFFFLPTLLIVIGLSIMLRNQPPFSRGEAVEVWRTIHALGMAIGSTSVLFGFLSGLMYLAQARRLKLKRAGSRFRLPTLEFLQRFSRRSLLTSTVVVGIGVLAGVIMVLNQTGQVSWDDKGIVFSGILFLWLFVASAVELFYAPARRGTKIAYLTMVSFVFLVLTLYAVLQSSHGSGENDPAVISSASRSLQAPIMSDSMMEAWNS